MDRIGLGDFVEVGGKVGADKGTMLQPGDKAARIMVRDRVCVCARVCVRGCVRVGERACSSSLVVCVIAPMIRAF